MRWLAASALLASLLGVGAGTAAPAGADPGGDPGITTTNVGNAVNAPREVPASDLTKGLNYAGLEASAACLDAFKVVGTNTCTHGPDAAPANVDLTKSVAPVAPEAPGAVGFASEEAALAAGVIPTKPAQTDPAKGAAAGNPGSAAASGTPGAAPCLGTSNGIDKRTAVLYVRAEDKTDRYSTYVNSIKTWAQEADTIYNNSALETGGTRHIRFVHDSSCVPVVFNVVIPASGDDTFGATITAVQNLGWNRTDRVYMMFVDGSGYCGIGNWDNDARAGVGLNNSQIGPSYGRTDAGCWGGGVVAHEHMHNLGGVSGTAPNHSGFAHCTDEYDRMCYVDEPFYPAMTTVCADSAKDLIFDCRHDDYFSTRAVAGNYLVSNWNAANSMFLVGNAGRYRYDFDYDKDGKKDIAIFRPNNGNNVSEWWIAKSSGGTHSFPFGVPGDKPVHGDFDGDTQSDVVNFRPSNQTWYIVQSSTFTYYTVKFGASTDIPVPGDYDRDGRADIAVYRPSTKTWYVRYTSTGASTSKVLNLAASGDIPVPQDYDDDDKTDMAFFRPSNGTWFIYKSSTGAVGIHQFGQGGDVPQPGDYDLDGKADRAVWRPSNGAHYISNSSNSTQVVRVHGQSGDRPVNGDFDGDNKRDYGVYRPSNNTWYHLRSTNGATYSRVWGQAGDIAIL